MTDRTILITGGTSGIGFELARRLLLKNNTVIVTGRDAARLEATQRSLPGVHVIVSDVGDARAIAALRAKVAADFPRLDMLINNAGIMRKLSVRDSAILADVGREIETNLSGPVRMVQHFLPLLMSQPNAAIVNVSSGLAFVPLAIAPVYSATKAAIHSYTQSLRIQLKNTKVRVIELAPPGTETPLLRGDFTAADLGGVKGMDVKVLVERTIAGLEKGKLEIRPGVSNVLMLMSRIAPALMARQLGRSAQRLSH